MSDTGIVRKVDELGRIVLPIELRRTLGIEEKDALSIKVDGNRMVLEKHAPACFVCGEENGLYDFEKKKICKDCIHGIATIDADLT